MFFQITPAGYDLYSWTLVCFSIWATLFDTPSFRYLSPTISHINYWDQVNSWKNLWKFWNGPLCWNKSGPFPLPNVAEYWQSSNTEACARNLSQILANNIDNGGGGLVSEFMWGIVGLSRKQITIFMILFCWSISGMDKIKKQKLLSVIF